MPENIYFLKIFEGIGKDVVDNIVENCETRKILNWEIIIAEWEESNWEWYILKHWKVWISINWNRIAELSHWDIFWEIALLNEEQRTATVIAMTDIEVIVLKLEHLIEIINNDSNKINKKIMKRIEENLK